ncbi:MAG: cyclic nucleotide-binding domain-containing protein [Deltaproteobacteria bacterium]|nr:cyclic nucleotide-binding domain-containing protein [Deltaproteobacteria bacterium]
MATINLRSLEALRDYSNAELKLLGAVSPAREYMPGDALCTEGHMGQSCFLVASGQVEVLKAIDGQEKGLATLRAGSIVGQMALVDRSPRSATVRASTYTIALELNREVFERLLAAHSPLALRFQHQIAVAGVRQLRMATTKLAGILNASKPAAAETPGENAIDPTRKRDALLTVKAALSEWDMSLDELDKVHVSVPRGQVSAGELRGRR